MILFGQRGEEVRPRNTREFAKQRNGQRERRERGTKQYRTVEKKGMCGMKERGNKARGQTRGQEEREGTVCSTKEGRKAFETDYHNRAS